MGSGCTKNNTVAHVPSFYVANASGFRILVYTSDSELSSLGLEATHSDGDTSNCTLPDRELCIGECWEFTRKFLAICSFNGKGEVNIKQPRLNQSSIKFYGRSVIVTADKIVMSVDLHSRASEKNRTEVIIPLKRKLWISDEDNKYLRPKDFYVANVSGYPIYVLPSDDDPATENAVGKERKVEDKQMTECRGQSVVIFANDHKTEICRASDVSPRKLIVVSGQSEDHYVEKPQLEGDDIAIKQTIKKVIAEAQPEIGWIAWLKSKISTPDAKEFGELVWKAIQEGLKLLKQ